MRLRNLWTIPVSILLLAACSSEMVTDSTTPCEGTDAVSYARLNVNLPTVPATRAYTPDAGDEAEYKVKDDPRIFIFEKVAAATSENDYTFLYEAQPTEWIKPFDSSVTGGDTDAHTGTKTDPEYKGTESFIVKLNTKARDLYALVVLNGANISAPSANEKFGDYNAALSMMTEDKYNDNYTNFVGNADNGFVMANAANSVSAGTDADPTVLVPLTTYNSPTAAKAPAAGNTVFVERSAVKVTVRNDKTSYELKSDANVTVTPLAWTLTNTNLKMYPFHRVDGLKNNYSAIWTLPRFLGNISYEGFRRTMWATDPNYAMDLTTEFHVATASDVTAAFSTSATENPLYCAENTFDIAHMKKGQTTAVIIKARLATRATTSANVYGVQGHVYSEDVAKEVVAKNASTIFGTEVSAENVDLSSLLGKEKATLTDQNFTGITTPTTDQLKQLNAVIGPITVYKDGICYYIGYIRHFDDETPWKSGEDRYGTGDDANKNYLGRYGVVRNNWYDLTIQDFAYPGSPDIPTPDPTAPDDDNSTIVLSVKVNPWAKETTKLVPLE